MHLPPLHFIPASLRRQAAERRGPHGRRLGQVEAMYSPRIAWTSHEGKVTAPALPAFFLPLPSTRCTKHPALCSIKSASLSLLENPFGAFEPFAATVGCCRLEILPAMRPVVFPVVLPLPFPSVVVARGATADPGRPDACIDRPVVASHAPPSPIQVALVPAVATLPDSVGERKTCHRRPPYAARGPGLPHRWRGRGLVRDSWRVAAPLFPSLRASCRRHAALRMNVGARMGSTSGSSIWPRRSARRRNAARSSSGGLLPPATSDGHYADMARHVAQRHTAPVGSPCQ